MQPEEQFPPMHIYPGVRFAQNPMEGYVKGAYFSNSENGWITQELFYGWLTKHFVRLIPEDRPVCLLVDGHASHSDLENSKFEKIIILLTAPFISYHSGIYPPNRQGIDERKLQPARIYDADTKTTKTFTSLAAAQLALMGEGITKPG